MIALQLLNTHRRDTDDLCPFFQIIVYSLGMTLYWSVDYHLPQNQVSFTEIRVRNKKVKTVRLSEQTVPVKNKPASLNFHHLLSENILEMCLLLVQPIQLSDSLNCLLLSMCEDMAHRRANLNTILEVCETHHKASLLPPPNKVIKQLVEDVFQDSVS